RQDTTQQAEGAQEQAPGTEVHGPEAKDHGPDVQSQGPDVKDQDSGAGRADGDARDGDAADSDGRAVAEGSSDGRRRPRSAARAAAAGAVVFTVAAAVLGWQWAEHNDPGPSEVNQAFVGGAQTETTQVAEAARNIVQGVFSYSYENLDAYQDSLKKFLNGEM